MSGPLLVAAGRTYRRALIVRTSDGARIAGEPFRLFANDGEAMAFVDARLALSLVDGEQALRRLEEIGRNQREGNREGN